jgi:molybdopterin synthase sulfur carrier subunit
MPVNVRIPTQLRELSGGAAEVAVEGATVAEVLKALEAAHPGFGDRLFDEGGSLRRFVNVFVADEDIRFLEGTDTEVADGQTVSIVPAVAGGSVADALGEAFSNASSG